MANATQTFAERKAARIAAGPKQNTFFIRARCGDEQIDLPTRYASRDAAEKAIWTGRAEVELHHINWRLFTGAFWFVTLVTQ